MGRGGGKGREGGGWDRGKGTNSGVLKGRGELCLVLFVRSCVWFCLSTEPQFNRFLFDQKDIPTKKKRSLDVLEVWDVLGVFDFLVLGGFWVRGGGLKTAGKGLGLECKFLFCFFFLFVFVCVCLCLFVFVLERDRMKETVTEGKNGKYLSRRRDFFFFFFF